MSGTALALRRLGAPILHWDPALDDEHLLDFMRHYSPPFHTVRAFKEDFDGQAYLFVPRREIRWAFARLSKPYCNQLAADTRAVQIVLPRLVELVSRIAHTDATYLPQLQNDMVQLQRDAHLLLDRIGDTGWTKLLTEAIARADYRQDMPVSVKTVLHTLRNSSYPW